MKDYDIFAEFEETAKKIACEEKMEITGLAYGQYKYYLMEIDLHDPDTRYTYKISIEKEEDKNNDKPVPADSGLEHFA